MTLSSNWTRRIRQAAAAATLPLLLLLLAACSGTDAAGSGTLPATYSTLTYFTPRAPTGTETPLTPGPTPTPSAVRFAVIGDYGDSGPDEEAVAKLVKSWGPDFVTTTGDNNYFNGKAETIDENVGQYYHEFIAPYQGSYGEGADANRFFPALGGHDWRAPMAQPHIDYFSLPGNEYYYDVRWGPVHLFVLDSHDEQPGGNTATSAQAQWLQETMAASDAPWKVVVTHRPPYSSGDHGPSEHMRWPFKEWGASAVLSGNDHNYERIMVDGIPYFVNGLGGGRIYEFGDEEMEGSAVKFNGDHGAMLVEADATTLRFQFITRTGEVVDDYTMTKG